ncbi:hypothetical protein HPB50_022142 [Hyalomma asiaticum]|uniref:Uncharacterized protein n=1 Tax=Hyalomma asiaticum TaxID=266040 RepID=A0ACB7T913_HYAAI|nr:hypothetical protein HPB50_022142 [Hyalomma asiaticum]
MEEFRTFFRSEFLPPDYERRMRRELELRTQHPDESLLEYIRALQELYLLADPMAPDAEKVERAIRQAHPTFAAYLRSAHYRNLNDLASDAKRIQGDILAAQTYRPPPPPSGSFEPRCAWAGGDSSPRNAPKYERHRYLVWRRAVGCAMGEERAPPALYAPPWSFRACRDFLACTGIVIDVASGGYRRGPVGPLQPFATLPLEKSRPSAAALARVPRSDATGPCEPLSPGQCAIAEAKLPATPATTPHSSSSDRSLPPLSDSLSKNEKARLSSLLTRFSEMFPERPVIQPAVLCKPAMRGHSDPLSVTQSFPAPCSTLSPAYCGSCSLLFLVIYAAAWLQPPALQTPPASLASLQQGIRSRWLVVPLNLSPAARAGGIPAVSSGFSVDIEELYYSVPHHELLPVVRDFLEDSGAAQSQVLSPFSVDSFLELLAHYLDSTMVDFAVIQPCRYPSWQAGYAGGIPILSCVTQSSSRAFLHLVTSLLRFLQPPVPGHLCGGLAPASSPANTTSQPGFVAAGHSLSVAGRSTQSLARGPSVVAPAPVPGCQLFRPAIPVSAQHGNLGGCCTQIAATPRTFPAAYFSCPMNFKQAGSTNCAARPLCFVTADLGCEPSLVWPTLCDKGKT